MTPAFRVLDTLLGKLTSQSIPDCKPKLPKHLQRRPASKYLKGPEFAVRPSLGAFPLHQLHNNKKKCLHWWLYSNDQLRKGIALLPSSIDTFLTTTHTNRDFERETCEALLESSLSSLSSDSPPSLATHNVSSPVPPPPSHCEGERRCRSGQAIWQSI